MQHHILENSHRDPVPGALVSSPDMDQSVLLTLELRRKNASDSNPQAVKNREDYANEHGAVPSDIERIEATARNNGIRLAEVSAAKRIVQVEAPLGKLLALFPATLADAELNGKKFRQRTGKISVPEELSDVIVAVHGYDTRAVATPHFRKSSATASATFTPVQVGKLYDFPTGDGSGATVAILEFGGGYDPTDITDFYRLLGIATAPKLTDTSVNGATNNKGADPDSDIEVTLDVEMVGAIAPAADIVIYFADNSDSGFVNAFADSVHAKTTPSAISLSWGSGETNWSSQTRTSLDGYLTDAVNLGIPVLVASGDNGSGDGLGVLTVDYPGSSPFAIGCGGTTITGSAPLQERTWGTAGSGGTGGGVSVLYPVPSFQLGANVPNNPKGVPGRGVPDISANADPESGYVIFINGGQTVVGGTSAVAPLYAGLFALIAGPKLLGNVKPTLYLNPSAFRDITTGSNDVSGLGQYNAQPGWDACTGLGTPKGTQLRSALTSQLVIP